jgi:DNA-binding response OmpR family regulator
MATTILLVDDDPAMRRLPSVLLKREGFEILEASSGTEALEILKTETPDLILLDIMMPDMDGFEVCEAIRENPRTADVPVIMLSAVSDQVRDSTIRVDDYLTKPFRPQELVPKVKSFLKS